ncbi:MAG: alpha/beta fold hydrolase [Novosphingobium sp.]
MKRSAKWVLGILVVLFGAFLLLRTPDTDPAVMKAKYGGPPSQFVDLGGGLTVHLRDEGSRDAPVLVLLHGSNADLHTWDAWAKALSGQFRVIRYDQIGHGLTGANPNGHYSPQAMVDVLERLRAKLGLERFAVAGNSMGGGIAARYASTYPQHVTSLILVDAAGAPRAAGANRGNIGFTLAAMPGINWLAQSITPRSLIARSLSQTVSNQAVVTPAAVDRYWELLRYPGNRAATMQRFAAKREPFTPAELARITAPTLILWGDEDPLIPVADTQFFAQGIKNARVKTWPGVGHLPHEEVADASAAEVRAFLSPQR